MCSACFGPANPRLTTRGVRGVWTDHSAGISPIAERIAAVALANKNVRTVWALLAHDREFSELCVERNRRLTAEQQAQYATDCSGDHAVMDRKENGKAHTDSARHSLLDSDSMR